MKIAFRGFRGFGPDTDFIELKELTIFTGKNGSGKSTFIKLLQLFSNFIKPAFGYHESKLSFEQLLGTSIKIGNEILGGATNLLHDAKNYNPEIIIRQRFDFYTFEHDVHFIFECSEYNLKLIKISISETGSKKLLMEFNSTIITSDLENLVEIYNKASINFNVCTDFFLVKKNNLESNSLEDLNYPQEPDLMCYHKNFFEIAHVVVGDFVDESSDVAEENAQDEFGNYPFIFKGKNIDGKFYGYATLINEKFQINSNDLENIIQTFYENEDVYDNPPDIFFYEELIKSVESPEELNMKLTRITNTVFKKLSVPISLKGINDMAAYLSKYNTILLMLKEMKINDLYEDFGDIKDIIDAVVLTKSHISTPLIVKSFNIYQSGVFESLEIIENINIHSSVKAVSFRSFNLFDYENSFSHFLRYFKASIKNNTIPALSVIKQKLNDFEIASDIEIDIHDTTAFIYLLKGTFKIPLIDDGSGINNLVSLMLFLSTPKKSKIDLNNESTISLETLFSEDSSLFVKSNELPTVYETPGIIVLEEPESNLHPNLQSKIADLVVDYIERSETKVIIETHSEYLIRKLQYLVSKGKCKAEDVSIYYFDFDPFSGKKDINFYSIGIRENGTLTREFGPGFFDEADNLSIDLFTLVQSQKN
ncbi:MAG: DUF3696 domain-containing protein [Saprospiraceae bacterium]|nr:DUF3696 domain-containing protein [Saprospiraceae bacterium]